VVPIPREKYPVYIYIYIYIYMYIYVLYIYTIYMYIYMYVYIYIYMYIYIVYIYIYMIQIQGCGPVVPAAPDLGVVLKQVWVSADPPPPSMVWSPFPGKNITGLFWFPYYTKLYLNMFGSSEKVCYKNGVQNVFGRARKDLL